jgi:hypothetical protein
MNPERLGLAACLALLVVIARPALAADDDGFKPLFNGKDLSGWVTPDDKTIFNVVDGVIVGKESQPGQLKKNEFLVSDRDYGDFVLKAKVQILGGNSGIQFRSKREPNGRVVGPQVDIADGYWGVLYDEGGKRGIIERYPPQKAAALVKEGGWNDLVVTMKGDHLTAVLNGTTILDRTDPHFPKSGVIALQCHAGQKRMEVKFKDLEIKADATP